MSKRASPAPLHLPGGVIARLHVAGADTGGAFMLMTDVCPSGWRLPAHRHTRESETIHVTAGRLALDVDGVPRELGPGDTAVIPRGVVHRSATLGDEPVHRVVVFSPSGLEAFFSALATVTEPAEGLRLAERHGWTFA